MLYTYILINTIVAIQRSVAESYDPWMFVPILVGFGQVLLEPLVLVFDLFGTELFVVIELGGESYHMSRAYVVAPVVVAYVITSLRYH